MTVQIDLLGPVQALVEGRPVALGSPTRQAVLAVLAMRSPDVVPLDDLITLVWGVAAPPSAAGNVQTYVSGLRRALEPERPPSEPSNLLVRVGRGYQLLLPMGAVDVHQFTELADAGRYAAAEGRLDEAAASLGAALSKWRGVPLTDVPGPFAQVQRDACTEQYLNALEAWAPAMLELGGAAEVVATLHEPAAAHLMRERLAVCLIEAMHQCGRDDEALAHYELVERTLREELGVLPTAELVSLRDRVTGDAQTAQVVNLPPVHLPADVRSYVGRDAELARMHEFMRAPAGSPRLIVLHGAGGAGKTALAVHFVNEVADRFPDGRLYVDLRGFAGAAGPLSAGDAAGRLLRDLGVPSNRIPAHADARVAHLRTLLAGTRTLLVLDNALDAEQVRPLLPGTDGCLTIVTSRRWLRGLVVSEGALRLPVGVLTESEALALLAEVAGRRRVAAERRAAVQLVHRCGLMPLALRIVAERAALRSRRDLAEMVAELDEQERRLDALSVGEESTTLRAVFSWSYAALPPEHARMFRLLGRFPGKEISVAIAAALAGVAHRDAERATEALREAHLLEVVPATGRYQLHDLLRSYALERFDIEEREEDKEAVLHRLLDWYLHGARAADEWLSAPGRASTESMGSLPEYVVPPVFADPETAADWCEAELPNMLETIDLAASAGFLRYAWHIPNFFMGFFILRCNVSEWVQAMTVAVEQCRALGDAKAEVRCRFNRLLAYTQVSQFERVLTEASELLSSDAIRLEPRIRPYVLNAIAYALLGLGRPAEAAEQLEDALLGEFGEQAARLSGLRASLGEAYTAMGRLAEARQCHEQALAMRKEQGELSGQSSSLRGIGELEVRAGDLRAAVTCFIEARWLARKVGAHREEALSLRALGDAYLRLPGRHTEALDTLSRALIIFEQLGDAMADDVRAELDQLSTMDHIAKSS
ncbi:hypothetical protein CFN78_21715 [Amycolatopsis antarctica]|uniref:OmpR/PhoB-type domain-containing protein n=1 Tax=Amycolatopsis antarctica TaxID=1854586 RepID=A0A263CY58_9PSEU|nr:BTAD domain-containing putative transcriptional regulator [Amycolatopsis antarctica]OZM71090.1 hypothetical protein CFN78_21715 [Amycolatopsis antarctica]